MKTLILSAILAIIATALICYDYNINGYNGTLTALGGVFGFGSVFCLPFETIYLKYIEWKQRRS